MATITAERPVEHLERSGFVVMKGPAVKGLICQRTPEGPST